MEDDELKKFIEQTKNDRFLVGNETARQLACEVQYLRRYCQNVRYASRAYLKEISCVPKCDMCGNTSIV